MGLANVVGMSIGDWTHCDEGDWLGREDLDDAPEAYEYRHEQDAVVLHVAKMLTDRLGCFSSFSIERTWDGHWAGRVYVDSDERPSWLWYTPDWDLGSMQVDMCGRDGLATDLDSMTSQPVCPPVGIQPPHATSSGEGAGRGPTSFVSRSDAPPHLPAPEPLICPECCRPAAAAYGCNLPGCGPLAGHG